MVLAPLFTDKLTVFVIEGLAIAFVLGILVYEAGFQQSENTWTHLYWGFHCKYKGDGSLARTSLNSITSPLGETKIYISYTIMG